MPKGKHTKLFNPKTPNQPSSLTSNDNRGHRSSDVDSSILAQHHTLGVGPNQSSPGNHTHDGVNSKFIPEVRYVLTQANYGMASTTHVSDPELRLPVVQGLNYEVELWVHFFTAVDCDINIQWLAPASTFGWRGGIGPTSNAAQYASQLDTRATFTGQSYNAPIPYQLAPNSAVQVIYERGVVIPGGNGEFVFQFAQNTAQAGNLNRGFSSILKVTRMFL